MKIVMIGHKYVPSREGGIEVVVEKLANFEVLGVLKTYEYGFC